MDSWTIVRNDALPMASDAFLSRANRTVLRPGREEPYLSIEDIVVFVRDLEVSKRYIAIKSYPGGYNLALLCLSRRIRS
jgi:hypothetical protein